MISFKEYLDESKTPVKKNKYTIVQAWKMDDNGFDVKDGWDLMVNGNWGNRYWYKWQAQEAIKQAKAEDALEAKKKEAK